MAGPSQTQTPKGGAKVGNVGECSQATEMIEENGEIQATRIHERRYL